jgi:apolipoprotein N-acyltransferase
MRSAILVVGAIVGGAAMAAAFPPLSWSPLIVVGMALLIAVARRVSGVAAFGVGLVAGMSGLALAVGWLWPTISSFAGIPKATGLFCGLVLLVYHAVQLALFGVVASSSAGGGHEGSRLAAAWVILEWLFPHVVPWSLGDALAGSALLRQGADLGGVHGLSFLIVVAAAALVRAVEGGTPWVCVKGFALGCFILGAMTGYGWMRLSSDWGAERALPVTAIQGGLGVDFDARRQNERAWAIYQPLTLAAVRGRRDEGVSLIVWPEVTLRSRLRHDRHELSKLRRLADRSGSSLLVGALDVPEAGGGDLNAAFLISPRRQGRRLGLRAYHKRFLLPFGEYVPGARWRSLSSRWKTTGSYIAGDYRGPLALSGDVKLGPSICFEAMQPGAANRMVADGAMMLVNLADDGRFAGAAARWQHLGGAVMRAVETRRWMVRVSDSGISAVIDPGGRVVEMLDSGAVGALRAAVPLRQPLTFYVRFGDWVIAVCVLILAGPRTYRSVHRRCPFRDFDSEPSTLN